MSKVRASGCAWGLAAALAAAPALHATNLNLRIESGGATSVSVPPGAVVNYAVMGELSDAASQGLALFSLDLTFSGGPLAPASAPGSLPMLAFAPPAGLSNPQGFGGHISAGQLRQVGGGQNTLKNTLAPFPNGSVLLNVAQPGTPLALVTGQVTAPLSAGSYTLSASGLVANVIRAGATGNPVWRVEPAGAGTQVPLTIHVSALHKGRARRR